MFQENIKPKKNIFDSVFSGKEDSQKNVFFGESGILENSNGKSWVLGKNGRSDAVYTSDSGLYLLQKDLKKFRRGEKLLRYGKMLDCVLPREVRNKMKAVSSRKLGVYEEVKARYEILEDYWTRLFSDSVNGIGISKAWNISIVCSIVLGMFLMTMLYRYLGEGASASAVSKGNVAANEINISNEKGEVAGASDEKIKEAEITAQLLREYEEKLKQGKDKEEMEKEIRKMVKGYPIEKMVPEIMKKDKVIAAFLVGIAKKESNWGKRVPVLNGEDCYNYWGYRGKRERMGTGGHTCFDSPKDAVDTVSKRLQNLVEKENVDTPQEMVVVWKCGYDCSWDSKQAVNKWISDVEKYFVQFEKASSGKKDD